MMAPVEEIATALHEANRALGRAIGAGDVEAIRAADASFDEARHMACGT